MRTWGGNTGAEKTSSGRGQTTLPALGIALVLLTVVTALGVAMADTAIAGADRQPGERRTAAATAALLVDADGPLADRANVLNRTRVERFDDAALRRAVPAAREADVAVTVGGRRVAATGDASAGRTVRRLVLLTNATRETVVPDGRRVTLPRRVDGVTLRIDPSAGTTVWTVRAGDRVLLHNDSGLGGTFEVSLRRTRTTRLRFDTAGGFARGAVEVEYASPRTTKATLAVTVDE
ncbi:DUF7263 family protein [Haloarcula litorea]|uniref:DUF7263 family protein n=1 Tax=Haloarcula litorea TaxID=3032579 RepID=UPI0023E7928F|nr:hypothetical protein [Halomicroarcula sp. GDY20]